MTKSAIAHISSVALGVASVLVGILQHGGTAHTAVYGGGGLVLATFSTIAYLFHEKGVTVASIHQAGSDLASSLPALRADLQKTTAFIEGEWPTAKTIINDTSTRVNGLVDKVTALPDASKILSDVAALANTVSTPVSQPPAATTGATP